MSYYRQTYGIELPDYRVDYPWWEDQYPDNLYQDNWYNADSGKCQATRNRVMCDHAGAGQQMESRWGTAGGNMLLHHLYGRLSNRVPYGGYWMEEQ
jgi:cell wall-associated NlpC family hydrolase